MISFVMKEMYEMPFIFWLSVTVVFCHVSLVPYYTKRQKRLSIECMILSRNKNAPRWAPYMLSNSKHVSATNEDKDDFDFNQYNAKTNRTMLSKLMPMFSSTRAGELSDSPESDNDSDAVSVASDCE